MRYCLTGAAIFILAYTVNMTLITVLYHRGLAHGALALHPATRRFVGLLGNWMTGLDPKSWVCMHRLHHRYADTPNDPHSPVNEGIVGVFMAQYRSYERILRGLLKRKPEYVRVVHDIEIPVHWLNRRRLWWSPYVVHLSIALGIGIGGGAWLWGLCYFFGLMSHPVQGWLVNSFGHAVGYRNFETHDQSQNNMALGLLVFGEGYQNNHHRTPTHPKFSVRAWEIDPGFGLCRTLSFLGMVRMAEASDRGEHSAFPAATDD